MSYLHPALDKWLTEYSYGRIRIRPGLDYKMRHLCALAALSGDIVWPQFRSSIMGTHPLPHPLSHSLSHSLTHPT